MDAQFDQEFLIAQKAWHEAAKVSAETGKRKDDLAMARAVVESLSKEKYASGKAVVSINMNAGYSTPEVEAEASKLAARLGYKLVRMDRNYRYGLEKDFEAEKSFKVGDRIVVACDSPGFPGKLGVIADVSAINTALITVGSQEGWVDVKYLSLVPDR